MTDGSRLAQDFDDPPRYEREKVRRIDPHELEPGDPCIVRLRTLPGRRPFAMELHLVVAAARPAGDGSITMTLKFDSEDREPREFEFNQDSMVVVDIGGSKRPWGYIVGGEDLWDAALKALTAVTADAPSPGILVGVGSPV